MKVVSQFFLYFAPSNQKKKIEIPIKDKLQD